MGKSHRLWARLIRGTAWHVRGAGGPCCGGAERTSQCMHKDAIAQSSSVRTNKPAKWAHTRGWWAFTVKQGKHVSTRKGTPTLNAAVYARVGRRRGHIRGAGGPVAAGQSARVSACRSTPALKAAVYARVGRRRGHIRLVVTGARHKRRQEGGKRRNAQKQRTSRRGWEAPHTAYAGDWWGCARKAGVSASKEVACCSSHTCIPDCQAW